MKLGGACSIVLEVWGSVISPWQATKGQNMVIDAPVYRKDLLRRTLRKDELVTMDLVDISDV